MLGAILFITTFAVVIFGPVGMEDPAYLAGWVTRFPDIKAARIVENLIYLAGLLLEVFLFLALYRALRRTSLAPAFFGSVMGIVGLTAMIVSSNPHIVHAKIFDLYQMPGATPADQATIALLWQAIWGLIDLSLYVGFLVVSTSILVLGAGMIGSPDFGKRFGVVAMVLGGAGLVMAVLQIIDPASAYGAGSYFAAIFFYLILGWRLFSLSRGS